MTAVRPEIEDKTLDTIWQALLALHASPPARSDGRATDLLALEGDPAAGNGLRWQRRAAGDNTDAAWLVFDGESVRVNEDRAPVNGWVVPSDVAEMCRLYMPLIVSAAERKLVVAHLGQSLDGRIATTSGVSQWVTGHEDVVHNHRMRALSDAVIVGAGTVKHDDPRLTVRLCSGRSPLRVVVDTERRLGPDYNLFTDASAETVVFCAADRTSGGERLGNAPVVGLSRNGTALDPAAIVGYLREQGRRLLFVEGGGVTVSRFLHAGVVNRLQVTIAPLIIGSGRPGFSLPEVDTIDACLRMRSRHFTLGPDIMFDCEIE